MDARRIKAQNPDQLLHPGTKYEDGQAKVILREQWRYRPRWSGRWIRARPTTGNTRMPDLVRSAQAGSLNAVTAPDGMYIQLAAGAATVDVLALEISGGLQNLHEKRSRFLASTSSLLLRLPKAWLNEIQTVQHGSQMERWRTLGDAFTAEPTSERLIPLARLRVFLLVPDSDLKTIQQKVALEAHEYLLPHSALDNQYHHDLKAVLDHAFNNHVLWG